MQFSSILAALALAATSVLSQDLTGLPDCAASCFTSNFANSACNSTDVACLCGDKTFFGDVEICVLTGCNTTDATTTLNWATAECAAAGVPLTKRSIFGRKH